MPVLNIKAAVQAMACSKSNVDQKMVPKQKKSLGVKKLDLNLEPFLGLYLFDLPFVKGTLPTGFVNWELLWHLRKTIAKTRRFPKCTIAFPDASCARGPKSLSRAYGWPQEFIKALAKKYGAAFVEQRLQAWRWDLTTCFAGIGCAGSVLRSNFNIMFYVLC